MRPSEPLFRIAPPSAVHDLLFVTINSGWATVIPITLVGRHLALPAPVRLARGVIPQPVPSGSVTNRGESFAASVPSDTRQGHRTISSVSFPFLNPLYRLDTSSRTSLHVDPHRDLHKFELGNQTLSDDSLNVSAAASLPGASWLACGLRSRSRRFGTQPRFEAEEAWHRGDTDTCNSLVAREPRELPPHRTDLPPWRSGNEKAKTSDARVQEGPLE